MQMSVSECRCMFCTCWLNTAVQCLHFHEGVTDTSMRRFTFQELHFLTCQSNESSFTLDNNKESAGKKSEENVSESKRARAKQSSDCQKNRDIDLSSSSEDQTRQHPSITETSSILQHIHMEAARPVKKTFTLIHTAYDKLTTSPALHLICHMSFYRSVSLPKASL